MRRRMPSDAVTTARRVTVAVLMAEVAVLTLSGVWLVFFYRPSGTLGLTGGVGHRSPGVAGDVRGLHRIAAFLAAPTAVIAGVLVVIDAGTRQGGWRQRRAALVAGPALVVGVLAALITGRLLPWDGLALWATAGAGHARGYRTAFGSSVRFAFVNGTEVGRLSLWRIFMLHAVAFTTIVVGALFIALPPRRRSTSAVPVEPFSSHASETTTGQNYLD